MISRASLSRRRRLGLRQLRRWCCENKSPRFVGRAGTTRVPCSSYCCGNPRKWFGQKTIQERRAEQSDGE